jgi:hypothetical protein
MPSQDAPPIPESELAVARAVARRAGRTVFAVLDAPGGRRLSFDRPDDARAIAYWADHTGVVRFGTAGRAAPAAAGRALVRDAASLPPSELAAARDFALLAGRTVFVVQVPDDDHEASAMVFAPPADGTLRYVVRVTGEVFLGDAAVGERAAAVADPGWPARAGARLRQLRRLRERAEELALLRAVGARDWARLERLIPDDERDALHPRTWLGARGPEVAAAIRAAADRELGRLRAEAARLARSE